MNAKQGHGAVRSRSSGGSFFSQHENDNNIRFLRWLHNAH